MRGKAYENRAVHDRGIGWILSRLCRVRLGALHPGSVRAGEIRAPRSAGPVPPYALDGSKKLFQIECISESAKDCPQPTSIPEPGTVALLLVGLAALAWSRV